jgi:hypothetical protein
VKTNFTVRVLSSADTAQAFQARTRAKVAVLQLFQHNVIYLKDGKRGIAPRLQDRCGEFFEVEGRRVPLRVINPFKRRR